MAAVAAVGMSGIVAPLPAVADERPVVLVGSLQDELGCAADWAPDCASTVMALQPDGTYRLSTDRLPEGSYEVKVTVGTSWDENYGKDGARGGDNIPFSTAAGKNVTFTYDPATHVLSIEAEASGVQGVGEARAYWVDATTLAWPASMLPKGVSRQDLLAAGSAAATFGLVTSPQGGARLVDGVVTGGTEAALTVAGELPESVVAAHPNLRGYIALKVTNMSEDQVREALKGQLAVVQRDAAGNPTAFTSVQTGVALDALYPVAADAPLGTTFEQGRPSFALWAPSARQVTLLSWNTTDATGSVAALDSEPVRTPAVLGTDGRWTVSNADGAITAGAQYQWEVEVYAPSTGTVETNRVTDPYSLGLTLNSQRSVALDLSDPALAPQQWATTASPVVGNNAARTIYELHVRDFSAADESVPAEYRGSYKAFTVSDSAGMKHLRELAAAGIDTVHLLPTFDIATIEEDRAQQKTPDIPASAGPASEEQQAAVSAVKDQDAYNWGYDPLHYTAPEGSYATTGNQDGGARTREYREMVGALHAAGLQVVLDQVFNHTAASGQDDKSVLDKIVPGYYQRLNAKGEVETSTCCSNTATENAMMERLMVDSVVTWAREYKVDGFRFDLMGHHSVETMKKVRAALSELTLDKDGVDGKSIYLYGEGWNFGEVANNALFTQATQGQLDGTGIGAFNDRLRDAVHGGGPFDPDHRTFQGLGTGQYTDPNGRDPRTGEEAKTALGHSVDLVKLGMAGNLKSYSFVQSDGSVKKGSEIDYNGQPAGYASSPEETVNYVDAHDNETLWDLGIYKMPDDTTMADRVRMNSLSLATVTLGQSPSFWNAGTEILRSKSLDRDSYNSGDYYNAIDWSLTSNGFGKGLPVQGVNGAKWDIMRPLLSNGSLAPSTADMQASKAQMMDFLKIRQSSPLFALGSAEAVQEKVSFPGGGPEATPGVFSMLIDDTQGENRDAALKGVLVVVNASNEATNETVKEVAGRPFVLHSIQAQGADPVVKQATFDGESGTASVPARTVAVYVEAEEATTPPTDEPTDKPSEQPSEQPTDKPADPDTNQGGGKPADQGGDKAGSAQAQGAGSKAGKALARTGAGSLVLLSSAAVALMGAGMALRRRRAA
nr:pullulanase-type alpha-1,6-glucosidase [Actinomyces sp.]